MKNLLKYGLRGFVLVAAIAWAAGTFLANNQPFGVIAPAVVNSGGFENGSGVAYTPWFENTDYRGDIIAFSLSANGTPQILAPLWHAGAEIAGQDFLTGRHIVTTDGAGTALSFLWDSLPASYQTDLGSVEMVNFIRGDRSNEGVSPTSRLRKGVLGDIIHSNPVYVKHPVSGFSDQSYLSYASSHSARPPRIFVGANDGMLHVLDALTGSEVYAYVPSMVVPKLNSLAQAPYTHTYYVDGPLTAEDAFFEGSWHAVVIGGLGAGGIGHFALDATSASVVSDADAMDKVLWEFHAGSSGAGNLGYSYSRASIVKTNADQWVAVIGNGYLSSTGVASLFVLDIADGSVIREIVVPDADANGLSSPTLLDANTDSMVDYAYAGDRNGNLWKFDMTDADPANWSVSNGIPLFQTDNSSGKRQPITTAPVIGEHQVHGFMIYIGTGELFDVAGAADTSVQAVYGIWDADWDVVDLPVSMQSLVSQQMISNTHAGSGAAVRTATDNPVDWETKRGWATPLLIADFAPLDRGERILQDIILRDDRIQFVTLNPTVSTGDNWFIQLYAHSGGAPTKTIIDVDGDHWLTVADNVDGDGSGTVEDLPADRVIGSFLGFGLASSPTIGTTGGTAAALFNHIESIPPTQVVSFPNDPGLLGGHFDLDTSHKIYTFDNGTTDGHVHQWDDKYNSTTVDYFNILSNGKLFNVDALVNAIPNSDTPFFLTISNTELSPGGVIEINGVSIGVVPYHELQTRWMTGTMAANERFPVYKLNPVTAAEKAAGWVQLATLKMSFDAFAILNGDLIGTSTGCVRDNNAGALGEYRNGALTLQAIDANAFNGFTYDALNDVYVAANTALDGTHHYARIAPDRVSPGQTEYAQSLFWESTLFWHWDGGCYGTQEWEEAYQACIVSKTTSCWVADKKKEDKAKKKKKKKKKKDKDDDSDHDGDDDHAPPDSADDTDDADSAHDLEIITTADGGVSGRLFWRELVPDD